VSSQNEHFLKFFSPLSTLPQFEHTFFILSTSATAPATFDAFFPFFPIVSPSNDAECFLALYFTLLHKIQACELNFFTKVDTPQ